MKKNSPKLDKYIKALLIVLVLAAALWYFMEQSEPPEPSEQLVLLTPSGADTPQPVMTQTQAEYAGTAYTPLNGNVPGFTQDDWTTSSYEFYSELDDLGRCGYALACIGTDLMPTESRGSISSVRPTGWQSVQYDIVDGKNLYNRCHLIGYQLSGENANAKNLITGTRYMNVQGMLPFENMVCDYVKETENHVLYRVTPVFDGNNLVADGVQMEAWSVEDEGEGVCFNVFCYNVQPGIEIDYATGDSRIDETAFTGEEMSYVLNTGSKKFHYPDCTSIGDINGSNMQEYTGTRELLIAQGFVPCGRCKP